MSSRAWAPLLLTIFVAAVAGPPAGAEERLVTLLYTNDIESVYEPVEAFWNPEIELIGGISYLATLIERVREESELSFLFDAGDIYTGALSQATEGRLAWDLYSLMGYDAVNLGNHEFEYGWQSLQHIRQRARFPVLSANLVYEGTELDFCQAYAILEKDGLRVGVDVIFGGHSDHGLWQPVRHPETGTWIGLTFGQGKYLGRLIEARVDGEPLDPAKLYTVASSAFLANGGDGYAMLAAGRPVRESEHRMSHYFLKHFRATGDLQVPGLGRQRDLARSP